MAEDNSITVRLTVWMTDAATKDSGDNLREACLQKLFEFPFAPFPGLEIFISNATECESMRGLDEIKIRSCEWHIPERILDCVCEDVELRTPHFKELYRVVLADGWQDIGCDRKRLKAESMSGAIRRARSRANIS